MSNIKKLASQTAVYGLSSILGRILNYLLVPIYTRVLIESAYGSVVEMYSYIALFLVVLTYGLETAFFRYSQDSKDKKIVYGTSVTSIISTSLLFLVLVFVLLDPISSLLKYTNHTDYIIYFALILFFDAINTIPFANLRAENKAKKFVMVKLIGIFLNIGLNLFFIVLVPVLAKNNYGFFTEAVNAFYNESDLVSYIFLANLISSAIMSLFFIQDFLKYSYRFSFGIWKKMMVYALPLLVFGLAGVVNEVIDRVMLKYLLDEQTSMAQVGIYGACYKVSLLMTIFIQAYKYAAEPFFFSKYKDSDARQTYANVMNYFVIIISLIFLGTVLYLDLVIYFVGDKFRSGINVIPILLLANMFLGIYYNLSIWYKLTDKTRYGAYIAIFGAVITIALNYYWIPRIGFMGSAWATLICYGSMMALSYLLGQKHYKVPYKLWQNLGVVGLALAFYILSISFEIEDLVYKIFVNSVYLIAYLLLIGLFYRKQILALASRRK